MDERLDSSLWLDHVYASPHSNEKSVMHYIPVCCAGGPARLTVQAADVYISTGRP